VITRPLPQARGLAVVAALVFGLAGQGGARAQTATPCYSAENALTGLYAHHLPPLVHRFQVQAGALAQATTEYCQAQPGLGSSVADRQRVWRSLHTQWVQTLAAWEALSTPAVGPVLSRRSQRQIDFWPTRPELIAKALDQPPQTLAGMERVGTLAKGLPAFELLLVQAKDGVQPAATCHYLELVVQGIEQEGRELGVELASWATRNWLAQTESDPEATRALLVEWLNQWLGGIERLRWMHIEKPLKIVETREARAKGSPPVFARLSREANLAGWRAQWASLRAQGWLTPEQRQTPPRPDQALVPIEALLLGKGHMALARRWARVLDEVDARAGALPAQAPPRLTDQRQLRALAAALKAVTLLYQGEVVTALDVPLGFSDADGD
jgi:predicted lipoprotein